MRAAAVMIGGVYEVTNVPYPMRVVAFDDHVVMYDAWWPHRSAWGMTRLSGRYTYYRLTRSYFDSHARYLRTDELTRYELAIHRPDLPLSLARHDDLSWYEVWGHDGLTKESQASVRPLELAAPAVFLVPFGPKDGEKPAVLVQARNGVGFTAIELLLHAHGIQHPFLGATRVVAGVGLYRSGIQKKVPSYYLWGSRSRLDAVVNNAV